MAEDKKGSKLDKAAGLIKALKGEKSFSGTLQTRHKSSDPNLKEFQDLTKYSPLNRYDGGNAVYGTSGTYFDAKGNFTNPENSMESQIAGRKIYETDVNFKNALVVTPDSRLAKKDIDLVKYAKDKGYDGLILEGFDDVEKTMHGNPALAIEHADNSLINEYPELDASQKYTNSHQDQVISFEPHKQAKVIGEAPANPVDRYKGDYYFDTVVNPTSSKIPAKASNFDYKKFLKKKALLKSVFRSLPYAGAAIGLATSPTADAAIDPLGSEQMDYDPAIEDPNSPEFRKRQSLLKALRGE